MSDDILSKAAKALAEAGASKGGKERSVRLSPERRREIARMGAAARWAEKEDQPDRPGKSRMALLERVAYAAAVVESARYHGVSGRERNRQWSELRAALVAAGVAARCSKCGAPVAPSKICDDHA